MRYINALALLLVIVGGVNWLLVGVGGFFGSNWNVVDLIFGTWLGAPWLAWIIYILVGASAIYEIIKHKGMCKECSASTSTSGM